MARTKKDGLDYFPLDVTFFSDTKIKVIRSRFGSDGIVVYTYLKCEVFKNGYYLKADDDFIYVMADELNIKENYIRQILNFLLSRSIFDNTLWQQDKILTSADIQQQYQESKKNSKRDIVVDKGVWLLKNFETKPFIKMYPDENNSEKKDDYSEKNAYNSESYTQSKVKKNKAKESKAKQIPNLEICNKIVYLYNYICLDLPEIQLTGGRTAAVQSLMNQTFNGRAITLSDIATAFKLVQKSSFLTGKTGGSFLASFDWIVRYENFVKIMEQKYSKLSSESYDIDDFERFAIGYIPPERQKLPAFCKDCKCKNPYECVIKCGNKAWADMR